MKKIVFISSTGGHLSEMLRLDKLINKYDSYIITEKTKSTVALKEKKDKVYYVVYGTKSKPFSYFFKCIINFFINLYLFIKIRPDIVISTGAHTAFIMCYLAKIFRKKVIYIETFANFKTKSLTGKLVYPIADLFLVQWEEMLKLYPKAKYAGRVY